MTVTRPEALFLLLLIPMLIWVAWPERNRLHWFRESLSLVARSLIILLIVLALAGLQWVEETDNLATIFVLDRSDSISQAGQETGLTYIRQALTHMQPNDRGGIVVFGADALVERTPSDNQSLREIGSAPIKSYSNLSRALSLALATFPNDAAKRLVILSDGAENIGDARQTAQIVTASGIELSVVPLPIEAGIEVKLTQLTAPPILHQGENFDLKLSLNSSRAMSVPVQIFSEGQLIAEETLTLQAGEQTFSIPQIAGESGFATFEAHIFPPQDTFLQNNRLESFSEVKGSLQILIVADQEAEGQPVAEALRSTGLEVELVEENRFPADLGTLSEYNALVMVNLPSFKLTPRQLALIQTYVRDLGRGLVVIGGDQSYGPGGYFQTPLEETLPVQMTITDTQRLPGMTIMMVIDKSGSMSDSGGAAGGPRKIELAKEAIYRSIDLLVPWDRIGVIAFDSAARWVVKPTAVINAKAIKDAVGTLRASGGTDIHAGLKAAAEAMLQESTQVRHIVLLTDGGANPSGIPELTKKLFDAGVTLSVVAIGHGYAQFLEDVAKTGGGRFHFANDATVIPQIFAQETSLATRSYLVEETFTPKVLLPSQMLEGLTSLPQLHGYVATSSKLTAQTVLVGGEEQDPLLVEWQYGLGRSVAWSSDAKAQWATNWLSWAEFPRFWSQVVRSTIVQGSGGVESYVELDGNRAVVKVEMLDIQGRYLNNLDTTVNIVDPDGNVQTIELQQTAPGLYEGEFNPTEQGSYFLAIQGQDEGQAVASQIRGFVLAYSPEYNQTQPDPMLLADLAAIGNGQILPFNQPELAFDHNLPLAQAATDLWPWLLLMAILILPLDVGLRRIIFGLEDLRLLWGRVRGRLPEAVPIPTSMPTAGGLLKSQRKPTRQADTSSSPWKQAKPPVSSSSSKPSSSKPSSSKPTVTSTSPAKLSAPPPDESKGTVQHLLRKKSKSRRRR
ncbi:VWA domain-containing protein [Anaerolineales bacterium HSG24]|nr:VWA domain-containing protein [Anaerolineales bacterium HSG24]